MAVYTCYQIVRRKDNGRYIYKVRQNNKKLLNVVNVTWTDSGKIHFYTNEVRSEFYQFKTFLQQQIKNKKPVSKNAALQRLEIRLSATRLKELVEKHDTATLLLVLQLYYLEYKIAQYTNYNDVASFLIQTMTEFERIKMESKEGIFTDWNKLVAGFPKIQNFKNTAFSHFRLIKLDTAPESKMNTAAAEEIAHDVFPPTRPAEPSEEINSVFRFVAKPRGK